MDPTFSPKRVKLAPSGAQIEGTSSSVIDLQESIVDRETDRRDRRLNKGTENYDEEDGASAISKNINAFVDLELRKYINDHAYELDLDDPDKFREDMVKTFLSRRKLIENDPIYRFVQHVAGTLGDRIDTLYYHDEDTQTEEMMNSFKKYTKEVAEGRATSVTSEMLTKMFDNPEISGRVRMKPVLIQAKDRVMLALGEKRGCDHLEDKFHDLIENPKLMVRIAELVGYEIMKNRQLDPSRTYKTVDYRRVRENYTNAFVTLLAALKKTGKIRVSFGRFRSKRRCDW